MRGTVEYARSGDVNIAYEVIGDGPIDVVLIAGFVSHLDNDWDHPASAGFLERLASFSRLIRFDKRGTGLSDRNVGLPDLETRMDDVRAVMDAAGSESAALFGYSEGGPMSILFAGTYPARVRSLALYGTYAKRAGSDADYPWASSWEQRQRYAAETEHTWGTNADIDRMAPGTDEHFERWWAARARASCSPAAARDLILMNSQIDVRDILPAVQAPTLVMHRTGDQDSSVDEGRYIASRIPGARFVELAGDVHVPWWNGDDILDELEEFFTGAPVRRLADRVLATMLFTDIVGSTDAARTLGDREWTNVLARHHTIVRAELARYGGEEIDEAGDGFFALFDGPARAIRCAESIRASLGTLPIQVRAGVHTGEIERPRGGHPRGIAVHTGARVAAAAGADEILVTTTTHDLVAGAGITFTGAADVELKGIGRQRVYAVAPSAVVA